MQLEFDGELYDADIMDFPNHELSAIKRAAGCSIAEFDKGCGDMDPDCVQVLIWICKRRKNPGLRVDDVSFTLREFVAAVRLTDDDCRDRAKQLEGKPDERTSFIAELDAEQRDRVFAEDGTVRPVAPVDPTPAADSAT